MPGTLGKAHGSGDPMIYSTAPGDSVGISVAVGDLDGDGIDDLLADAPLENTGDLTYFGLCSGDVAGLSVAAADLNGDRRKNLALGALQADRRDDSSPDAGEFYVILQQ